MKCFREGCNVEITDGRPEKKFCSDHCRVQHWMDRHPRKKPAAKRKDRSARNGREREHRALWHALVAKYGLDKLKEMADVG